MHPALKLIAGASFRFAARASIALTRIALLKVKEMFRADSNENTSSYYDAIHDDDKAV
tara:strand:- start:495 stop:668 length:174 start_codon:yes stop_codon:yes gene_type:complete